MIPTLLRRKMPSMMFRQLGSVVLAALAGACWTTAAAIAATPADVLSLKGKRVGITVAGTEHYWDLKAYQGQIDEVKRLGGTPIALDAGRNDSRQIGQIQTLIGQKPDVIIEQLGNGAVLQPWLKKIRAAGIPLFTVDTVSPSSLNDTTSDNYGIGEKLALQMASDLGGHGRIVVFNGFYSVPVCAIRYDELRLVLKAFPDITIVQPELRDVIPNTVQNAYAQVTDMLAKYPHDGDVSAVWSAWDVPQVGATQAIAAAHRSAIRTYGVDGSPDVVKMVVDPASPAGAVVAQQPYVIGRTAVDNAARYLAGDRTIPAYTFIPSVLVTKANAADAVKAMNQGG